MPVPVLRIDFPLEASEDNIVAHLQAMVALYALPVPTITALGKTNDDDIIRALKKGPTFYVVFENDYAPQQTELAGDTFQNGWRVWRVLVLCSSMRGGPSPARRGTEGAYYLSDAVKQFLTGYDPVSDTTAPAANYPMLYLGRHNAPSEDLTDYLMLLRFAHPIEVSPE